MFVTICQACLHGNHDNCDPQAGTEHVGYAGGACVCTHVKPEDRDKFEQSIWERMSRNTLPFPT